MSQEPNTESNSGDKRRLSLKRKSAKQQEPAEDAPEAAASGETPMSGESLRMALRRRISEKTGSPFPTQTEAEGSPPPPPSGSGALPSPVPAPSSGTPPPPLPSAKTDASEDWENTGKLDEIPEAATPPPPTGGLPPPRPSSGKTTLPVPSSASGDDKQSLKLKKGGTRPIPHAEASEGGMAPPPPDGGLPPPPPPTGTKAPSPSAAAKKTTEKKQPKGGIKSIDEVLSEAPAADKKASGQKPKMVMIAGMAAVLLVLIAGAVGLFVMAFSGSDTGEVAEAPTADTTTTTAATKPTTPAVTTKDTPESRPVETGNELEMAAFLASITSDGLMATEASRETVIRVASSVQPNQTQEMLIQMGTPALAGRNQAAANQHDPAVIQWLESVQIRSVGRGKANMNDTVFDIGSTVNASPVIRWVGHDRSNKKLIFLDADNKRYEKSY